MIGNHLDNLSRRDQQAFSEPGFAARLVAETDSLSALLIGLGHSASDKRWDREGIIAWLSQTLVKLDQRINCQLNQILHDPVFQALEANWRGVWLLTEQVNNDDNEGLVKIKILDVTWRMLSKDLARSIEFDQSRLFAKIYSEEFGTPGGAPFGLLLGAYSVSHRADGGLANIDTLKELAHIACAAFAPLILNAAPSLFGVNRFSELTGVTELESHFSQSEMAKWRSLRAMEDSRFIGLAVPRMLMRAPYRDVGQGPEAFRFQEDGRDSEGDFLWGHACFAVGLVAIRAFCESGWFSQIRGFRSGHIAHGMVDKLSLIQQITPVGQIFPCRSPVDWQVSDRMERVLSEAGFVPLMPLANTAMLVIHSVPSVQEPDHYDQLESRVSAKLAAMLHYTLCVSRFAHYLKVMGRDRVGGYRTPEECEAQLQKWLHGYTMASEGASDEMRARFPLRDASVTVRTRAGEPGRFYSVIRLQPHFQMDQLVTGMRLITELTPVLGF